MTIFASSLQPSIANSSSFILHDPLHHDQIFWSLVRFLLEIWIFVGYYSHKNAQRNLCFIFFSISHLVQSISRKKKSYFLSLAALLFATKSCFVIFSLSSPFICFLRKNNICFFNRSFLLFYHIRFAFRNKNSLLDQIYFFKISTNKDQYSFSPLRTIVFIIIVHQI